MATRARKKNYIVKRNPATEKSQKGVGFCPNGDTSFLSISFLERLVLLAQYLDCGKNITRRACQSVPALVFHSNKNLWRRILKSRVSQRCSTARIPRTQCYGLGQLAALTAVQLFSCVKPADHLPKGRSIEGVFPAASFLTQRQHKHLQNWYLFPYSIIGLIFYLNSGRALAVRIACIHPHILFKRCSRFFRTPTRLQAHCLSLKRKVRMKVRPEPIMSSDGRNHWPFNPLRSLLAP